MIKLTQPSLSEQLYTKPTHFLLELIQNADDNTYRGFDVNEDGDNFGPSMKLIQAEDYLEVHCNEVGFKKANVEAICRIARSTKAAADKSKGFIGEKGIGFKSVFKVADVVWISSNDYTFKFDKRGTLGMITPIWDPSPPMTIEPGWTQFCLQFSSQENRSQLQEEHQKLDARILMFVRQLKCISVEHNKKFAVGRLEGDSAILSQADSEQCGGQAIELTKEITGEKGITESTTYLVQNILCINLPKEDKRPHIEQSIVTLAFPIDQQKRPIITSQQVYAFLPIRDYGFPVCAIEFNLLRSFRSIED